MEITCDEIITHDLESDTEHGGSGDPVDMQTLPRTGTQYAIRVDSIDDKTDTSVINFLRQHTLSFILFEEIGARTSKLHYQGLVELRGSILLSFFRIKLKRVIKANYKNAYSVSIIKDIKHYECYISKDKKLYASEGYSKRDIQRLMSLEYDAKNSKDFIQRYLAAMRNTSNYERPHLYATVEHRVQYFEQFNKLYDQSVIIRFVNLFLN